MEKPIHTIENDRLLNLFPLNLIIIAFLTFFLGNFFSHYFIWAILFFILFILDHLFFSNTWLFFSDRIEVKFRFRHKIKIFYADELEFKCIQGKSDTPIVLKKANNKSWSNGFNGQLTSNVTNSNFIFIYQWCNKRKIKMTGPWEKIISDL